LLGVHRVNSIKYNLDIKEFLKWKQLKQQEAEY
jgi:hypothetical protein